MTSQETPKPSQVRYLFINGKSKKKVEMEVEGTGANRTQLREKASGIFGFEDFTMQSWDKHFEEWLDIEEGDKVATNTKILITKSPSACNSSQDTSTISSVSDVDPESDNSDIGSTDGQSPGSAPDQIPGPSSIPSTSTSTKPASSLSVSPNWHFTYKLPTFSASIEAKLQGGQQLKEAERSAILEAIYNSVKIFTYYPKTGQYDKLIDLLLEKYPKLVAQKDMCYANVKTLWKYRLQYKFSNARKREDSTIPEVKSRKRKSTPSSLSHLTVKRSAPQWGMQNYLPQRQESEDDASIKIHKEWMQQEWGKRKPNYSRVAESMVATLADRRRLIVSEGATLVQVKEQFPWLFDDGELLLEFQRIEGTSSMEKLLSDGLQKYGDAVLSCIKTLTKKSKLVEKVLSTINLQKEESARKELTKQAAVLAIPGLLNEKVEHLMVSEDGMDETDLPVFIKTGTNDEDEEVFGVMVDGIAISSSSKFDVAFANYLSAYYCFNLAYPKCLRKTLQFFQKVVLNIQDNLPIDKTVVKILEKLNKIHMC